MTVKNGKDIDAEALIHNFKTKLQDNYFDKQGIFIDAFFKAQTLLIN